MAWRDEGATKPADPFHDNPSGDRTWGPSLRWLRHDPAAARHGRTGLAALVRTP